MTESKVREEICRLGRSLLDLGLTPGLEKLADLRTIAFAALCAAIVGGLAATAGAAPSDRTNEVTLRGDDALRLLVGNTLRSVQDKKSIPTFRYFMNERLEYHCEGWNFSNVRRSEIMIHRETAGCEILIPSVRDGRLCENYATTCEDNELALRFRKLSTASDVKAGQLLGRVTVLRMRYSTAPGEYDLIKGNATIFPDFDPATKQNVLQSEAPDVKIEINRVKEFACTDGTSEIIRLDHADEVNSAIIGNTLIPFNNAFNKNPGTFDARNGNYFDPKGIIVSVGIPTAPEGAFDQTLSGTSVGGISLYRWKIEDGKLCRTEGEEPAKFFCDRFSVYLEKASATRPNSRYCVLYGYEVLFVAKGNPFAIDFSRSTGK